jgi:hypothetical protein
MRKKKTTDPKTAVDLYAPYLPGTPCCTVSPPVAEIVKQIERLPVDQRMELAVALEYFLNCWTEQKYVAVRSRMMVGMANAHVEQRTKLQKRNKPTGEGARFLEQQLKGKTLANIAGSTDPTEIDRVKKHIKRERRRRGLS